jgi:adenine-specific DNA-methyltransferase
MMLPRLKLLRELLSDDGVIFISIDDNEVHRLRELLDDVYGEVNYIGTFVWRRRASSALAEKLVSVDHEYVVAYHRGDMASFIGVAKTFESYSNPDNDPNGDWTAGDLTVGMTKAQRPNQFYELTDPKTGRSYKPNPNRVWAFIPESMAKEIAGGRVIFPDKPSGRPMVKRYRKNLKSDVNPVSTWIRGLSETASDEKVTALTSALTSEGGKVLQEIFQNVPFNYSKPPSLISSLIKQVVPKDGLVLDSFAGSATTAHAVLALNKEDGGNRKFILVECEDYADTITAERVRRVIKGVKGASDEALKKGLGGSFSYFELGKAIELDSILDGKNLPEYHELARYVFYTATGEEFDERKVNEKRQFVGESKTHEVYLFYRPDIDYLKKTALTLDRAEELGKPKGKRRLVFAPTKYLDQEQLDALRIDFAQLPFEIYKLAQ